MSWSVFDGAPPDSHEGLFRFARLKTPNGKAVLAGLEWADDSDWYIAHALENGFKPSADDVIEILEGWGYDDQEGLLYGCLGPFTQAQVGARGLRPSNDDVACGCGNGPWGSGTISKRCYGD